MSRKALIAAALGAVLLMLGACGGGNADHNPSGDTGATLARPHVTWELVDCSGFRRYSAEYIDEMTEVAKEVASRRGKLLMACTDGQPLTTAKVRPFDFSELPPGVTDPDLLGRINQARAAGLAKEFKTLSTERQVVKGSGQLQALALVASATPAADVYYWTDAAVNDPARSFETATATSAELDAEIRAWAPRLKHLTGTITFLGVGRGVHDSATVEKSERLFRSVLAGSKLRWTQTLAQL